ncbi:uncharacterized protein LOC120469633 [Pimephales promelas]|uniref:uncharacterized protein LOC120469633 n=1 Tax=Pimephales promelas TaxID=90988 RepID=UPI001955A847|nr:uncharacterized protein LOC120469633 [Pimephales promelas]
MATAHMPAMKRFALHAYALLFYVSCVSMTPSVFQPNVSVTAPAGGSVILECYTTVDPVVTWVWLKQIPGQKLSPIVSTYYKKIKLQEEFVNESRLEVKVDDNKSALIFNKITSRDAAYYHCGVQLYEMLYFGGASYLTVNDAKPIKVIQRPVLDSHHEGDSVTLHCSIFGETCSGEQSIYWLKYEPRESHSGLIYSEGDRKDQCEKISVSGSTVQNCVHKVPKSLASDETYFCSVVTCGKLFIGNGTKLTADVVSDKTAFYIIALLSAVLVILVIVNIIMVLSWRRTAHRSVGEVQSTAQIADTESENYASLKFSSDQSTRKIKGHREVNSVVYASVRKQIA